MVKLATTGETHQVLVVDDEEVLARSIVAYLERRGFSAAYAVDAPGAGADDLVQAACLKALERWHQWQAGTSLAAWRAHRERWHRIALDPSDPAALARLLDEVNASVADYEQLKMLVIVREPWSIENGCLTPTMKIKRARIESMLEPELGRWYADKQKVLWQ